jgi:subtilisin-like proprotein convertase family protein
MFKIKILMLLTVVLPSTVIAQTSLWKSYQINPSLTENNNRLIRPSKFDAYTLDTNEIKSLLNSAPMRNAGATSGAWLEIPMPTGGTLSFQLYNDPIMHPDLAAQYPSIQTYCGWSDEDPTAFLRCDFTPQGFHAMLRSATHGTIFIDPLYVNDQKHYQVYSRKDFYDNNTKQFICNSEGLDSEELNEIISDDVAERSAGDCQLRTYRIAIAGTGEYTAFHGGTVALALAAMNTTMNRVNQVYEKECAIRMQIIATNNSIIYTNAGTDPYTNGDPDLMIDENQTNIDAVIGTANYDLGHVFGTNSGGLASTGPCSTTSKARGVTGSGAPIGDPFDIDYVAHEIGHQFSASHTFNGLADNCGGGNANPPTAVEPGSGSTIMAYAGICDPQNIQMNSDPYFHSTSLLQIANFVVNGLGSTCGTVTNTPNSPPTANAGLNYAIPRNTPFMLNGVATDPNSSNALTHCWEQMDNTFTSASNPTNTQTSGAVFRSFQPTTSTMRVFPQLTNIVNNTSSTWEVLPNVARTLSFRYTVRDNVTTDGGCTAEDSMSVFVQNTSGPFVVTQPSASGITMQVGSSYTVNWNVVGTNTAPINASNVDIFLSTDGGFTYPITLATSTANDGTHNIIVPNNVTTTARIMVKGANNIFFDISNNNFTIQAAPSQTYLLSATPLSSSICPTNGSATTYTVTTQAVNGFNGVVTFGTTGLPSGVTASFLPTSVTGSGSTTLTLTTNGSVAANTYNFTITSNSGSINQNQAATLIITPPPTLSAPANNASNVDNLPQLTWVNSNPDYTLEIAPNSDFSSDVITYSSINSNTFQLPEGLDGNTQYYWRVTNSAGCVSNINTFTTKSCQVFANTTLLTIPEGGTVNSTLVVSATGTITDLNVVSLNGTHTYIEDLRLTLISPVNTQVILFSQICGSQDNFNVKFDDAAASNTLPCPPVDGNTYQPNGMLSVFNGQQMSGTWTLRINDYVLPDGGQLNNWGIQVCANNLSLPVELLRFDARPKANDIELSWVTSIEINNDGFELQRREADERDFKAIAWLDAQAIAGKGATYNYTDQQVEAGKTYYYRLRQVDLNGEAVFSDIAVASLQKEGIWGVLAVPNPAREQVEIVLSGKHYEGAQLRIYSSTAQLMYEAQVTDVTPRINVPLSNWPAGVYLIEVNDGQRKLHQRLMHY